MTRTSHNDNDTHSTKGTTNQDPEIKKRIPKLNSVFSGFLGSFFATFHEKKDELKWLDMRRVVPDDAASYSLDFSKDKFDAGTLLCISIINNYN